MHVFAFEQVLQLSGHLKQSDPTKVYPRLFSHGSQLVSCPALRTILLVPVTQVSQADEEQVAQKSPQDLQDPDPSEP